MSQPTTVQPQNRFIQNVGRAAPRWRLVATMVGRKYAVPAAVDTVTSYLAQLAQAGAKASTISRRLAALAYVHRAAGVESPTREVAVREVTRGLRRQLGTAPATKAPLLADDVRRLRAALPGSDPATLRDRAVLLVGFVGALRRSELVGLNVADLVADERGYLLRLGRTKTDQEGRGERVALPRSRDPRLCPVRALDAWLAAAEIRRGAVFRPVRRDGRAGTQRLSDRAVARIVQRACARAGMDPTPFSGHSLRAGMATMAALNGASERGIMRQTRHKGGEMVQGQRRRPAGPISRIGNGFAEPSPAGTSIDKAAQPTTPRWT